MYLKESVKKGGCKGSVWGVCVGVVRELRGLSGGLCGRTARAPHLTKQTMEIMEASRFAMILAPPPALPDKQRKSMDFNVFPMILGPPALPTQPNKP